MITRRYILLGLERLGAKFFEDRKGLGFELVR